MDFDEVIKNRTATKKFKDKKVSEECIVKILNSATLAPTAKNMQPQKIYVLESEKAIKRINKVCPCIYGATIVMLVCADKNIAWNNEEGSTKEMDASIVATHMILEATNLGVDTCWVKYFDSKALIEEFNLPQNIQPICIIPMGYKADDYMGNPNHKIRKSIEEISKRL